MQRLAALKSLRLDRAVRLVWKASPGWTLASLGLTLVQGLLPLAALLAMQRVVDAVTAGITAVEKSTAYQPVLGWIGAAAGIALLTALARSLSEMAGEAQGQLVTDTVADILHEKSAAVDLGYYEDPAYYDTLHRAQQEAPYRPTHILNGLVSLAQNSLSLVGVAALLFSFRWQVGLVLFLVAVPGALVRLWHSRRLYHYEERQAVRERQAWYYHWMLVDSDHAREVRLFDLGGLFRARFQELRRQLRQGRLDLARRRSLADFVVHAAASLAVFGSLAFAAVQAVNGSITLGALVMYYLGFQSGLGFLQSIMSSLAGLYEDNLFLAHFFQFLDLRPAVTAPAQPVRLPAALREGICFDRVTFTYPNGSEPAVREVSLSLAPGEVIALVGENGAGKTTLIKLLARLYDPQQGAIRAEGLDLRQLDPQLWRRRLGVILQDYVHYYLSAAENIWFGDSAQPPDSARLRAAAEAAGAAGLVAELPQGYDTVLGTWFEGGRELSSGEWQKIATARAFYRGAEILVLDEPTSALDPLAEAELFRRFHRLLAGRSAILISHRFSTVQMADRIYVLDGGRIIEEGTHAALLALGGHYARMYHAQAQYYQPGPEAA